MNEKRKVGLAALDATLHLFSQHVIEFCSIIRSFRRESFSPVAGGESGLEGLLHGNGPGFGLVGVVFSQAGDVGGDLEEDDGGGELAVEVGDGTISNLDQSSESGGRVDSSGPLIGFGGPFGDQAVGGGVGVEGVGSSAVHVLDEPRGRGAQAIEVEPGVAGLEGVEGPGQAVEPFEPGEIALGGFEPATEPFALLAGHDARQLRVKAKPPLELAEEGEREAQGLAGRREGAEDQAAVELRPDHRGEGDNIAVIRDPPGQALGVLAGQIIGDRLGPSDRDPVIGHALTLLTDASGGRRAMRFARGSSRGRSARGPRGRRSRRSPGRRESAGRSRR